MRISPEVEIALSVAATEAARRNHEYFTVEHLLFALLHDDETAKVVKHAGGDVKNIKAKLSKYLDELDAPQRRELRCVTQAETPAGALGLAFAGFAVVFYVGEENRLAASIGVALLFFLAAAITALALRRAAREKPRAFDATISELQRDLNAIKP